MTRPSRLVDGTTDYERDRATVRAMTREYEPFLPLPRRFDGYQVGDTVMYLRERTGTMFQGEVMAVERLSGVDAYLVQIADMDTWYDDDGVPEDSEVRDYRGTVSLTQGMLDTATPW